VKNGDWTTCHLQIGVASSKGRVLAVQLMPRISSAMAFFPFGGGGGGGGGGGAEHATRKARARGAALKDSAERAISGRLFMAVERALAAGCVLVRTLNRPLPSLPVAWQSGAGGAAEAAHVRQAIGASPLAGGGVKGRTAAGVSTRACRP
jgi:hypothetical protein